MMSTTLSPEEQAAERYPADPFPIHGDDGVTYGDNNDDLREGYSACLTERAMPAEQEVQELRATLEQFNPDSNAIIDGGAETWRAAGYEDPDKAAERFRGGLRQAFIVGWQESRIHLIGKSLLLNEREAALTRDNAELRATVQELVEVLDAMWLRYTPTTDPVYRTARNVLNKAEKNGFHPPDGGMDLEAEYRPSFGTGAD